MLCHCCCTGNVASFCASEANIIATKQSKTSERVGEDGKTAHVNATNLKTLVGFRFCVVVAICLLTSLLTALTLKPAKCRRVGGVRWWDMAMRIFSLESLNVFITF